METAGILPESSWKTVCSGSLGARLPVNLSNTYIFSQLYRDAPIAIFLAYSLV